MTTFHYKCPHCGHEGTARADMLDSGHEQGAHVLPTDRSGGHTCYILHCDDCWASFVLDFEVRERPQVGVLPRSELVLIQRKAKKLATKIRGYERTFVHKTPPPVNCPGCGREFGEVSGYPEPMPKKGLCAVCSQELERQLAIRKVRRG